MSEDKDSLRELAAKLAVEMGDWIETDSLIAQVATALQENTGRYDALAALDKIKAHIKALEDERWEVWSHAAHSQAKIGTVTSQSIKAIAEIYAKMAGAISISISLLLSLEHLAEQGIGKEAFASKVAEQRKNFETMFGKEVVDLAVKMAEKDGGQ